MKDKKKTAIARCAILFFGFAILGTVLSRAAAAILTPTVWAEYVSSGEIEHEIVSNVTVSGGRNVPIYVCEDIMVEEIYVTGGERVSAGDSLLRVNTDELEALYLNKKLERKNMKLRYWYSSEDERRADELDIKAADDTLNELEELVENGGILRAEAGGVVAEVRQSVGSRTTGEAAFVITEEAQSYTLKISITEEQKENVKAGDKAVVKCGDVSETSEVGEVYEDSSEPHGCVAEVSVSGEKFRLGDAVQVSITHTSGEYDFVVPITAVHSDASGSYVLVLREKETILGTELAASKVLVKAGESDAENVGVISETLSGEDRVIVSSDKSIASGDVVREK